MSVVDEAAPVFMTGHQSDSRAHAERRQHPQPSVTLLAQTEPVDSLGRQTKRCIVVTEFAGLLREIGLRITGVVLAEFDRKFVRPVVSVNVSALIASLRQPKDTVIFCSSQC